MTFEDWLKLFLQNGTAVWLPIGLSLVARWFWGKVREEIKTANREVVEQLQGIRADLKETQAKVEYHESFEVEIATLKGQVQTLLSMLMNTKPSTGEPNT